MLFVEKLQKLLKLWNASGGH